MAEALAPGEPPEAPQDEAQGELALEEFQEDQQHEHEDRVEQAFPWLASGLLHLGLFLVVFFVYSAVTRALHRTKPQPIIIPQTLDSHFTHHPGGIPHPGPKSDPLKEARQEQKKLLNAHGFAKTQSKTNVATLLNSGAGSTSANLLAVGSKGGLGDMPGVGGASGALAAFGVGGGGEGMGPQSNFMGVGGGNARRIVFVLDSSGFMVNIFQIVKQKAIHSIDNMVPIQRFAVITFSKNYHFVGQAQLVRATSHNKRLLRRNLKKVLAEGQDTYSFSKFYRPMKAAFELRPQLIYFLTDGRFNPKLVAAIRKLNVGKKVRIVAYACVGRKIAGSNGQTFTGGTGNNTFTLQTIRKNLKQIATDSGGKFRMLYSKDFFGG